MGSKNTYYIELYKDFGEEKIKKRYLTLRSEIQKYIERKDYSKNANIADSVLNQVVLDYFVDIKRLKDFHEIDNVNFLKIHAYTAYWILRRKPIQIIKDNEDDVELAFVNENFVASYLLNYLREKNDNAIILEDDRRSYFEFIKNIEYSLRYRIVTAQMIETMLEAYNAGMAFQRADDYEKSI